MKRGWLAALFALLLLAGCGGGTDWSATLQAPPQFALGQELPLVLTVKADGKPVTGLVVKAQLEMKKMDHGTVEVVFAEKGEGVYEAKAKLPMGGDWVAVTEISDGKQTKELELPFAVEGVEAK